MPDELASRRAVGVGTTADFATALLAYPFKLLRSFTYGILAACVFVFWASAPRRGLHSSISRAGRRNLWSRHTVPAQAGCLYGQQVWQSAWALRLKDGSFFSLRVLPR